MSTSKPNEPAANQGNVPAIACFNKAITPLGVDFDELIAALQVFLDDHVAPVWGASAKLVKSDGFIPRAWAMVFLDDSDQPGGLAYHNLTPDGLPVAKVFVKAALANHDLVSVVASHQLAETLVDPAINLTARGPEPSAIYAYECVDPVEELGLSVNGIAMSDFVYPAYFQPFLKPGSVQFDHLKKVGRPFQILSGGYQIIFKNGKWTQIYGSDAKKKRFAKADRRGHRSAMRGEM